MTRSARPACPSGDVVPTATKGTGRLGAVVAAVGLISAACEMDDSGPGSR